MSLLEKAQAVPIQQRQWGRQWATVERDEIDLIFGYLAGQVSAAQCAKILHMTIPAFHAWTGRKLMAAIRQGWLSKNKYDSQK